MRELIPDLIRWQAEKTPVALATVIQTWGSSPRRPGACMALTARGEMRGSVSGGCVENAVVETGLQVLASGRSQFLSFNVSDESAWQVGLACGGRIEVFVSPFAGELLQSLVTSLQEQDSIVLATVIHGPQSSLGRMLLFRNDGQTTGDLAGAILPDLMRQAQAALINGTPHRAWLNDSLELFINVFDTPPTLVIIGGVHIAMPLVSIARLMGFRTVVLDPRRSWGNSDRFPDVDRLIHSWPAQGLAELGINSHTAIAVLSHDPKLDDAALKVALASPAFYVGALGSRSTNARRQARLRDHGLTNDQLTRLHAPIGVEISAATPEQIALSIMTQIIQVRNSQASSLEALSPAGVGGSL